MRVISPIIGQKPAARVSFDILWRMSIPNVDEIIRTRRKTIAIIVQRGGKVVVRAPVRATEVSIRRFVESKSGWIAEKKAQAAKMPLVTGKSFQGGEMFLLLGKEYPLRLVESQKTALTFQDGFFLRKNTALKAKSAFEKWYKTRALEILTERVDFFARKFGLRYEKIRISSARTRWGSCSARGTLSFTWRLVMAPLDVVDYVVIHELAHLRVRNHSAVFWAEVARMMPDFKPRLGWLRKNGQFLTLDGE